MHKKWGESNTSSKVCSNLSEYIYYSFCPPRKHLQWRSHFSYIFSRKVLIYGLALIQPINHVFQLQHAVFSSATNGCSVSITYMRNITMYVDLISNTYKEYSWRSKTFWMPLFSKTREFLILFKGIFSYCIISGKNFTMQMRSLKKRSKRLLSFVTGLGLVLNCVPSYQHSPSDVQKCILHMRQFPSLTTRIVEDGSSWCTYWFPCQGKH